MVLASIRHHVVLHTACCLRTILVLHDTVALVVYHSVPLGFQQFLVHTEVCECGDHHALAAFCSSSSATVFCPAVKVTYLHVQIMSVLYPVAHLLLARGHNEYSSLTLLHKSLGNAKSRKRLARTRAVGEHIALAVGVLSVRMLIAEELCLCFQHVFLLLRQKERQSLLDVLLVAYLYLDRLGSYLSLVLLGIWRSYLLLHALRSENACPFAKLMGHTVNLDVGVPHVLDVVIHLLIAKAELC